MLWCSWAVLSCSSMFSILFANSNVCFILEMLNSAGGGVGVDSNLLPAPLPYDLVEVLGASLVFAF